MGESTQSQNPLLYLIDNGQFMGILLSTGSCRFLDGMRDLVYDGGYLNEEKAKKARCADIAKCSLIRLLERN
jgi:hypothetical protein